MINPHDHIMPITHTSFSWHSLKEREKKERVSYHKNYLLSINVKILSVNMQNYDNRLLMILKDSAQINSIYYFFLVSI